MKKLIIIGANEYQTRLVLKAKDMKLETHVFAWDEGAVAKKYSDYFYPISIVEKDKILEIAKSIQPSGIVSIASDLAVLTVNYISDKLALIGNSFESAILSTNKYEMVNRFIKCNIPCPKFVLFDETNNLNFLEIETPIIVKPIDRSGSRGVIKVQNKENLREAINYAMSESLCKKVIIEEYIEGNEYSMEIISQNGVHKFITITEKFTTGAPNFIETAHIQPAQLDETVRINAINIIKKALDSLEIKNGASHSEFKVTPDNKIKIIEIGSRMGGDFIGSDLVELSTGFDFTKAVIDVAIGNMIDTQDITESKGSASIKFILDNNDLNKYNIVTSKKNDIVHRSSFFGGIGSHKVIDSSTRYGYYILKCNSREECLQYI